MDYYRALKLEHPRHDTSHETAFYPIATPLYD